MSKSPIKRPDGVYNLTLTVVGWTDVFIRSDYREFLAQNLQFNIDHKGLEVYCFCLMTNHLHMIAGCRSGDIHKTIREFKSFTGKNLLRMIQQNLQESRRDWLLDRFAYYARILGKDTERQFWDRDNYPQEIETDQFFLQKQNYIHQNPVRAGFVARPEEWFFSSACPDCPITISESI
jgi:putative transposase